MNTQTATNTTLRAWLAVHLCGGISIKRLEKLLTQLDNIADLFSLNKKQLQQLGLSEKTSQKLLNPPWQSVDISLAWQQYPNQHIITIVDNRYPPLLQQIAHPPLLLFAQGNLSLLTRPQLAVIGSRNPSQTGKETAYLFAKSLGDMQITITSGLALGIDTASHHGALETKGSTIAVTGCGPDIVYPRRNQLLAEKIATKGLLLSEYAPGTPPKAKHFPQRNRIISGLGSGTLVIEASLKSGSLITANFALEQGREVFAVPGSIHNPMAKGCHKLIKQGAKLVETIEDITEELQYGYSAPINPCFEESTTASHYQQKDLDNIETNLLSFVGYEVTSVDQIANRSGKPIAEISAELLNLELDGYITAVMGGYIRIK